MVRMNKTRKKNLKRMIHTTRSRFFSLTAIVAIGVAFFLGLVSSGTVMSYSVQVYDDELNLKDITVYSNYGFDEDDIDAVKVLDEVADAEGMKFADVYAASGSSIRVTRVHAYNPDDTINQFQLREGRLPENEHEALAEAGTDGTSGFAIGSTVTLSRPSDDLSDYLNIDEVTIVGTIDTPLYLNETKESSTLSNQAISTYLYVLESCFSMDYDTELNVVTVHGKNYDEFSDAYYAYTENVQKEIEDLGVTQAEHRRDAVVAEAEKKLDDAKQEYEDGKNDYDTSIAEAEQQLEDSRKRIQDAERQIADGKAQISDGEAKLKQSQEELLSQKYTNENKILDARAEISAGQTKLDQGKQEFAEQKSQAEAGIQQIDTGIEQLNTLQEQLTHLNESIQLTMLYQSLTEEQSQPISAAAESLGLSETNTVQDLINACKTASSGLSALLEPLADLPDETPVSTIIAQVQAAGDEESAAALSPYEDQTLGDLRTRKNNLDQLAAQLEAIPDQLPISILLAGQPDLKTLTDQMGLTETSTVAELKAAIPVQIQALQDQKTSIQNQLADGQKQIDDAQAQLDRAYAETVNAATELYAAIDEGQQKIDDGWAELEANRQKIADAEAELAEGKQKLQDGEAELETQKADGAQKLEDARAEIDAGEQKIQDLEAGSWTVLTRLSHYASESYRQSVNQMKAIAGIFPVFFLAVAALVCMTTMTRLIEEQRGQIGIMRALGYTPKECASSYLIYAGMAALIGEAAGTVLGLAIFPPIIYYLWKIEYVLPPMKLKISWSVMAIADLLFLAVMELTSWKVLRADMKEVPAQLMRPKAPRLGKNTFLEKIPAVWNSLSFTWKVTIRNLFRYKKRFFMTVIGVAGCCALLITGFGVQDSIDNMVSIQYEEIYQIDAVITLKDDLSASELSKAADQIADREDVSGTVRGAFYNAKADTEDRSVEETVNAMIFRNEEDLSQAYDLRTRVGHDPISLSDDGVIISEKMSENMHLAIGDTFLLEGKAGLVKEVKVAGIAEMYMSHFVWMSEACYQSVFGTVPAQNSVFLKLKDGTDPASCEQAISAYSEVSSLDFCYSTLNTWKNTVHSLNLVVYVLIISSMALAFVVLGNLTNVNISERTREIATLKVLGFRKREVESYIYKENMVLTVIGALCGIPLGVLLHHTIMREVEMDAMMFGRTVDPDSILWSVLLTIGFSILVNRFMRKRLHDISMVESLKSVE